MERPRISELVGLTLLQKEDLRTTPEIKNPEAISEDSLKLWLEFARTLSNRQGYLDLALIS